MAELVEALPFLFTKLMPFWTYIIQCADRHFYAGHTDDLERRIGEHQLGVIAGYSSTRLPVHLVWSAEFPTRDEARTAELQIKGWSRAKKLALIRGDWAAISALARSRQEGRASTSSVKPAQKVVRSGLFLHPHPAQLPASPLSLEVQTRIEPGRLSIGWRLTGELDRIAIPEHAASARRDNLWQRTCCEAFVRTANGYVEFNMSPSTEWAAYAFSGYRKGMREQDIAPPSIRVRRDCHAVQLTADITLPPDTIPTRLGLSAVIEEVSGTKSYWALRHPPGDKPDFHHPDCFALELPPASDA